DDRAPSRLVLRQEMRVECVDELLPAAGLPWQPELAVDRLQELERGERRVEDVRRRDLRPEIAEERAEERRLPRPDLPRDADEAARFSQTELEVREGLGVLAGEKEVARVR